MTDKKSTTVKQIDPRDENSTLMASRKERKETRDKPNDAPLKKTLWVQMRLIPIWLRIILVLALLTGAAILGAMFGYGYIGDGVPSDVLKKETWTHILDIISGK